MEVIHLDRYEVEIMGKPAEVLVRTSMNTADPSCYKFTTMVYCTYDNSEEEYFTYGRKAAEERHREVVEMVHRLYFADDCKGRLLVLANAERRVRVRKCT